MYWARVPEEESESEEEDEKEPVSFVKDARTQQPITNPSRLSHQVKGGDDSSENE
jgi:hypothetical protein